MLLTNANIITMKPAREIVTNGALLLEGNQIKALEADTIFFPEKYGLSPVYFAESVGLLEPKSVLRHMVWLNDQDIAILDLHRCIPRPLPIPFLPLYMPRRTARLMQG
jgi:hypothetical protein